MGKLDWSQVGRIIGGILDGFVNMSLFLEHTLGYGWGYMVFVLISAIAALWPPISRWANMVYPKDGSQGISADEAAKRTRFHALVAAILFAAIDGYVYYHGGCLKCHA